MDGITNRVNVTINTKVKTRTDKKIAIKMVRILTQGHHINHIAQ